MQEVKADVPILSTLSGKTISVNPELTVANGVRRIENYAFQYTNLTTVSLPATITYLGYESFGGCKSLSEITFAGTTTQWNKIDKPLWKEGTPRVIVRCSNGNVLAE